MRPTYVKSRVFTTLKNKKDFSISLNAFKGLQNIVSIAYTCIYMYKQTLFYHSDTCSVLYQLTNSFSFEVDTAKSFFFLKGENTQDQKPI